MFDNALNISTDPASGNIDFLYDTAKPTSTLLFPNSQPTTNCRY